MKLLGIFWTRFLLFGTFILIPLWVLVFVVNYIISFKKEKKYDYLMPLMIVLTQIGLLFFYTMAYPYYGVERIRIDYAYANIIFTILIKFLKIKNKQRLYIIPFVLAIVWLITYIY